MMISNESSPLTVRGLDPGMMYSVMINVFDGNQVVLRAKAATETITVINAIVTSGKLFCVAMYICIQWDRKCT